MRSILLSLVVAVAFPASSAYANAEFPAKLAGHAVLPAATFIEPPADAPADLKLSGRFTGGARVDAVGTVMGRSNGRPTGLSVPFPGQPVQGHSGVKRMADGSFWVLIDNGFGSKLNSPDAMLFLRRYSIDWAPGTMAAQETVWLHDPDRKVPFRIANEATEKRYLAGSDFDPEGF
jgi:hypothetical protein